MEFFHRPSFNYKEYLHQESQAVAQVQPASSKSSFTALALIVVGVSLLFAWADSQISFSDSLVAEVQSVVRTTDSQEVADEREFQLEKAIYSLSYPESLYVVRDVRNDTEILTFYDRVGLHTRAARDDISAQGLTLISMIKHDAYTNLGSFAEDIVLGSWNYSRVPQPEVVFPATSQHIAYDAVTDDGPFRFHFLTEEGYPYVMTFMYPQSDIDKQLQTRYKDVMSTIMLKNYNLPQDYREQLNAIVQEFQDTPSVY